MPENWVGVCWGEKPMGEQYEYGSNDSFLSLLPLMEEGVKIMLAIALCIL